MLVLSRKCGEVIVIPEQNISIQIIEVRADRVRIGITAPDNIEIHRKEVWVKRQLEAAGAQDSAPLVS